ncbi:hypothetical protein TNIN_290261 [Trichonephila inaurata madagascariensis]|uniref:Uncharacterized protein n=1 Tax=Trichonephila inaurata madagascariensis TaxID=2747483 RepID=A0A8X6MK21_9ARAC|nr:hypothetical protein TNIN_290261 [Trichonephila inaurata madagascariensis]
MANLYLVARQPLSSVRRTTLPEGHHVEVGYFGSLEAALFRNSLGQPRECKETPPLVYGIACKKINVIRESKALVLSNDVWKGRRSSEIKMSFTMND